MGKWKPIQFDQALHGYSNGHRLLASSRHVGKAAERTMLVLSDMSGPSMISGFDEYLTGCPLPDEGIYAFAKTWYAPEMERPGCVWTHTLLIKSGDLGKIPDLSVICKLFHRPSGRFLKHLYEDLIRADCSYDAPKVLDNPMLWGDVARSIIYYLYGEPHCSPVLLSADKSSSYENLILNLWSQQWPELRNNFTFCTGSLSNRSLDDKNFDLQVIPTKAVRQFLREVPHAQIIKSEDVQLEPCHYGWVSIAAKDLLDDSSQKLRKYLWDVGNVSNVDRSRYAPLVKIYDYLRATNTNRITIDALLHELKKSYPTPKDGNHLKKRIFGPFIKKQHSLLTGTDEPDLLRALATTKHHSMFSSKMLQIRSRTCSLWSEKNTKFRAIIIDLIGTDINSIGEEILISVAEIIEPDELFELSNRKRGLLFVFVERRPELASYKRFWTGTPDYQRELLDHLVRGSPKEKTIKSIVNAMLDAHADSIAEDAYSHFRKPVVNAFLEWFDKGVLTKETHVYSAWIKILRMAPEESLAWLSNAVRPKAETAALIASQLDPHSNTVKEFGTQIWLRLLDTIKDDLNYKTHRTLAEFLLPFSLNKPGPHYDKLVEFSFEIIHGALARGELSYDSWRLLELVLPRVPWYRSWDKCEWLRYGVRQIGLNIRNM